MNNRQFERVVATLGNNVSLETLSVNTPISSASQDDCDHLKMNHPRLVELIVKDVFFNGALARDIMLALPTLKIFKYRIADPNDNNNKVMPLYAPGWNPKKILPRMIIMERRR